MYLLFVYFLTFTDRDIGRVLLFVYILKSAEVAGMQKHFFPVRRKDTHADEYHHSAFAVRAFLIEGHDPHCFDYFTHCASEDTYG